MNKAKVTTLFCRMGTKVIGSLGSDKSWKHLNTENPHEIKKWLSTDNKELEICLTEEDKNNFQKVWFSCKRYIIPAYERQSNSRKKKLEIRKIAEKYFNEIKIKLQSTNIKNIVFKENPHIFFDVMLFLVAKSMRIQVIYYEYFLNNSIITKISIINGQINRKKINSTELMLNDKIEISLKDKLKFSLSKYLAYIFGGGLKWDPVILSDGKYLILNIFKKIELSVKRELKIRKYYKQLMKVKQVKKNELINSDIVVYFHFQPESSTMPYGHIFADQIFMCNWLAKKFPKRRVLIKEHPAMLEYTEKKTLCFETFRNDRLLTRMYKQNNIYRYEDSALEVDCWVASINGTIIGERMNLTKKTLVMENIALVNYVGSRTFFMDTCKIVARGRSLDGYINQQLKIDSVINFKKEIV